MRQRIKQSEDYALLRAESSMMCLPFRKTFYEEIDTNAISGEELSQREDLSRLVFVPFSSKRAEKYFAWMIRLGILRREVDGQGLTNRVRLTRMGRRIVGSWRNEAPRAGLRKRIQERFRRHCNSL